MNTHLGHIQVNIKAENLPFYTDLLEFLGWSKYVADETMAGYGSGSSSLWFIGAANDNANDYDGIGMNHIGIGTETKADVDSAAEYLASKGIPALFETPRLREDFASDGRIYYQVMIASPDNVLFEIVYTGPE